MKDRLKEKVCGNMLFHGIEGESLDRMLVCSKSKVRHFEAGELIFQQEDSPTKLFLLLEGAVHIVKNFASGRKNILLSVEEGNIFGENFLFGERERYWYDAEALSKTAVLEIPWNFFHCFCDSACAHHQQLVQNMMEILSYKEFMITKKLHIISATSLREKIAIWLLDSADEKGRVRNNMTREALAGFLGVARPSLSRELMRMQEDGLLKIQKKDIIIVKKDQIELLYL